MKTHRSVVAIAACTATLLTGLAAPATADTARPVACSKKALGNLSLPLFDFGMHLNDAREQAVDAVHNLHHIGVDENRPYDFKKARAQQIADATAAGRPAPVVTADSPMARPLNDWARQFGLPREFVTYYVEIVDATAMINSLRAGMNNAWNEKTGWIILSADNPASGTAATRAQLNNLIRAAQVAEPVVPDYLREPINNALAEAQKASVAIAAIEGPVAACRATGFNPNADLSVPAPNWKSYAQWRMEHPDELPPEPAPENPPLAPIPPVNPLQQFFAQFQALSSGSSTPGMPLAPGLPIPR